MDFTSTYAIGDHVMYDGEKYKVEGVLFLEGKVFYHLEGSHVAKDSAEISSPGAFAQVGAALRDLGAGPFTQRTEA